MTKSHRRCESEFPFVKSSVWIQVCGYTHQGSRFVCQISWTTSGISDCPAVLITSSIIVSTRLAAHMIFAVHYKSIECLWDVRCSFHSIRKVFPSSDTVTLWNMAKVILRWHLNLSICTFQATNSQISHLYVIFLPFLARSPAVH